MQVELVERAQAGDEQAFASLAVAAGNRLHAVAYRILRDVHLAEDATQQALLAIWRDLPQLRDPARFDAWSYRVLVRSCHAADPCHPERGAAGDHIGPLFANELEQDLAALTGFTVSAPEASTIDGLPATRFSISNTIDTNSAGCTVEDQLPLFETTEGLPSPVTTGGSTLQVWVVNLGRSPLLIIGDPGEPGPSAGQTGIDEAIASITVVNGTPTPSSPLSNPPTPTAEAATLDRIDVDRPLEGGTYQLAVRRPDADAQVSSFNVTLPAGWILQALRTSEAWFSGGDGERPYLGFFDVSEVYRDPCHPENGYAGHLGSWLVSDFESALGALPGFTASAPEDVTIDGHPASRFFISNAINTEAAGCTGGDTLTLLRTSQGRPALATTGGSTLEIWAVKRNSPSPSQSLPAMLIVADVGQATPALDQAAIDAIVSSITFGL